MKKQVISILLASVMALSAASPAIADEQSDLERYVEEHKDALSSTQATLDELSGRRLQIQSEISTMNADLVNLMVEINQAEDDIASAESRIKKTAKSIKKTAKNLSAAEKTRDRQYEAMQKRIQYIYENGGNAGWAVMVLQSDNISAMLNKAEYAQEIQATDRSALKTLEKTVTDISNMKTSLEKKQKKQKEQKSTLEAQKTALEADKASLDKQIEEKKATDADYGYQIEVAQAQADELSDIIRGENARIAEIEAEKQAAAEEAARAAAEEEERLERESQEEIEGSVELSGGSEEVSYSEKTYYLADQSDDYDSMTWGSYDEDEDYDSYDEDEDNDSYDEDEDYDSYDEDEDYDGYEEYDEDEDYAGSYDEDYDSYDEDYDSSYDEDYDSYDEDYDSSYDEDYDSYDEDYDGYEEYDEDEDYAGSYDEDYDSYDEESYDSYDEDEDYDSYDEDYEESYDSYEDDDIDYFDEDDYDDYDEDYDDDDYDEDSSSGSGSGEYIVDYARQFVGNPYVYGGNSLTNGCDCSHFVYLVLSNCGVYSGGYMTSGEWAGAGSSVGSLSEARAGDVIVYSGHVAIYDGNGCIVEAQSSSTGITDYRSASYKGIVSIRRFT